MRQEPEPLDKPDKAAKEALGYAAATPGLGPVPALPISKAARSGEALQEIQQVPLAGDDSETWVVYVPQSHPKSRLTIRDVRRDFLAAPGVYRHAFAFSLVDPLRCRRLKAATFVTPQPPYDGAVTIRAGAPRAQGWRLEDLGEEFRVNWKWWGLGEVATADDLLRKILVGLGTLEHAWKKRPRTIPGWREREVWDLDRLFGLWKVRES